MNKQKLPRRILLCLFVSALSVWGLAVLLQSAASGKMPLYDFIQYWSASSIFFKHGNPYDAAELLALQHTVGLHGSTPIMMWNPPWTLLITMPFGLLPYGTARALWLLLSLVLILWSADWLWSFFSGPKSHRWLSWLGALLFFPDGTAIYLGQISPFMLFGVTGFLWSLQKKRYLLAGAAAFLIAVKPHVLFAFWIVLILWIWKERLWRILTGLSAALFLGLLAVSLYHWPILAQYVAALKLNSGPLIWQTPTWGVALQMLFPGATHCVRFLPSSLGSCIAIWLFFRWSKAFNWRRHLVPILLLSIITGSFTWMFDWVVLLPLIVLLFKWFQAEPARMVWLPLAFLAIEGVLLFQPALAYSNFYSIWMPPALGFLYMAGRRYAPS